MHDAVGPDGVTAALWDRSEQAEAGRAFVAPATTGVFRSGLGGGGGSARGSMGGLALAPTPELLAKVDALPPADDDPEVDVAAEAAASEHFRLRSFLRPYRRPLLIGFALIVVDTLLTLAGPFLVQQGLNEGVEQHATSALWTASALFLAATDRWALRTGPTCRHRHPRRAIPRAGDRGNLAARRSLQAGPADRAMARPRAVAELRYRPLVIREANIRIE